MMTQVERLREYLTEHPGASSMDVTLDLRIVNVTGRISDLRAAGDSVKVWRDQRGIWRYGIVRPPVQAEMGL